MLLQQLPFRPGKKAPVRGCCRACVSGHRSPRHTRLQDVATRPCLCSKYAWWSVTRIPIPPFCGHSKEQSYLPPRSISCLTATQCGATVCGSLSSTDYRFSESRCLASGNYSSFLAVADDADGSAPDIGLSVVSQCRDGRMLTLQAPGRNNLRSPYATSGSPRAAFSIGTVAGFLCPALPGVNLTDPHSCRTFQLAPRGFDNCQLIKTGGGMDPSKPGQPASSGKVAMSCAPNSAATMRRSHVRPDFRRCYCVSP